MLLRLKHLRQSNLFYSKELFISRFAGPVRPSQPNGVVRQSRLPWPFWRRAGVERHVLIALHGLLFLHRLHVYIVYQHLIQSLTSTFSSNSAFDNALHLLHGTSNPIKMQMEKFETRTRN